VSFWVCGILVNLAIWLAVTLLVRLTWLEEDYDPTTLFAMIAGAWLLSGVVSGWQVTGVWRSGGRTMRERRAAGRGTFWTTMGTGLVIVGTALLAWQFIVTGVPQLRESWKMAFLGDPDIPDYAIRTMRSGTELEISGGIKYGLDRDLRAALDASPDVEVVHLDSRGGRIGEARKVYETIRERGLLTYVAHQCNSACTIAFLGGRERLVGPSGALGFHSAFFPGAMQPVLDTQATFLLSKGIDREFVRRVITTPNGEMWFPTVPELEAAGIVTGEAPDDRFAVSGFGPDMTPESLKQKFVEEISLLAALSQADPAALDSLMTTLYERYAAGATSAEIIEAFSGATSAVFDAHMPLAADRTVRAFAAFQLETMRRIVEREPRACYAFGGGREVPDELYEEYVGDRGSRRLAGIVEQALWTSDPGHGLTPDARDAARRTLDGIVADLAVRRAADGETVSPADEEAYCRARLAAWERVDALGDDAVPLLRLMLEHGRDGVDTFTGD
jgi:hypothetical protein